MHTGWFITILGIILIEVGTFFTFYGQSIKDVSPKPDVISKLMVTSRYILSPQQEKLLAIVYKYQKQLGLNKLIIAKKEGRLHFDDKEKREKYSINIIGEVFDISSDYSLRSNEFENLILHMPSNFLKIIPESRLDSPYVVMITEEGIEYIKKCK